MRGRKTGSRIQYSFNIHKARVYTPNGVRGERGGVDRRFPSGRRRGDRKRWDTIHNLYTYILYPPQHPHFAVLYCTRIHLFAQLFAAPYSGSGFSTRNKHPLYSSVYIIARISYTYI